MALEALPSDGDLLRGMAAGDERAFVTLYRKCQASLYRFALQMTGNAALAEEVTQEVFMTLIREPKVYNPSRGTLQAFLLGVCRNHVLRRLSEETRYVGLKVVPSEESSSIMEDKVDSSDPLAELAEAETVERVRRAVLSLPAHHREAVVLCDLNEMSYEQASAVLGCPVGTVRSRLHRARELLLIKLKRWPVISEVQRVLPHRRAKASNELSNLQDDCA